MKQQHTHSMYDTIDQVITDGVARGLGWLSAEDERITGPTVKVGGRDILNFGTASYMSLEHHPALLAGARDALDRYGTQFAASRTYIQLGLYNELEGALSQIFGKPALATGSTTLGHMSAIPVLVGDRDAIILDHQVHSSIQTVVQILKARGVPLSMIRHNRIDQLEKKIQRLKGQHERIWYFADGVYSMFGDGAPAAEIHALMDRYDQLRVYVDDAHGFSWTGRHGCGYYRSRVEHHPNLVLAVSLNKSYASAGGALIFPTAEMKRRVRACGPTMIFCGPIQPPMLGAATACAKLHLSDAIVPLQAQLGERIRYCNEGLAARGLPQVDANDTPLYFVPTGLPQVVYPLAERLLADGICVNIGGFPAVPMNQGGIRFHMHRELPLEHVDFLLDRLAVHWKTLLHEAGTTPKSLARAFRLPHLQEIDITPPAAPATVVEVAAPAAPALQVHSAASIDRVPAALWDSCFSGRGPMDVAALQALEPAFAAADHPGDRAALRYVWVTGADDRVVLATAYSAARVKEDMFASAEISEKVEALRATEGADFLVTTALSLGCPLSLGPHLYLDREYDDWRGALKLLVDHLLDAKRDAGATQILLREFETGADPELGKALRDLGFAEVGLPDMMTIESLPWDDRDGYLASLKSRYRYDVRREILPHVDKLRIESGVLTDTPDAEAALIDACYALYMRVHARGRRMNVFPLPRATFGALAGSPAFDVLRFYADGAGDDAPAAVMLSHRGAPGSTRYTALLVGFDESLLSSHGIYKVSLFCTVERARALGATSINMAYTAELVKKKIGARPRPTCAFVMLDDTFGAGVMQNL